MTELCADRIKLVFSNVELENIGSKFQQEAEILPTAILTCAAALAKFMHVIVPGEDSAMKGMQIVEQGNNNSRIGCASSLYFHGSNLFRTTSEQIVHVIQLSYNLGVLLGSSAPVKEKDKFSAKYITEIRSCLYYFEKFQLLVAETYVRYITTNGAAKGQVIEALASMRIAVKNSWEAWKYIESHLTKTVSFIERVRTSRISAITAQYQKQIKKYNVIVLSIYSLASAFQEVAATSLNAIVTEFNHSFSGKFIWEINYLDAERECMKSAAQVKDVISKYKGPLLITLSFLRR